MWLLLRSDRNKLSYYIEVGLTYKKTHAKTYIIYMYVRTQKSSKLAIATKQTIKTKKDEVSK